MAEYLNNEVPQKMLDKAKRLKKTGMTVAVLEDDDVESISGGYRKATGYAKNFRVACPICGRHTREGIDSWENDSYECSVFYCENCDYIWGIDRHGNTWEDFF